MKKLFILFLLVIYSGISFGQSLIEENKIWNVVTTINYGPSYTLSYKFEGDTTINDLTYKVLWGSADSTYSNWYFESLFREDSTGKVFRYTPEGEELFYDFGLNTGDQFNGMIYGCQVQLTVDSTDMVTLENGEMRKRWIFNYSSYYQEEWIQGIGSLFGLISVGTEQCGIDIYDELNCFTENDTLKYDNPDYEPCFYTTVGITETKAKQKLKVTPNPFTHQIKLTFNYSENIDYEIRLLNAQGIVLKKYNSISSGELNINTDFLTKGIYFIRFFENGEYKYSEKVIK